MKFSKIKTTLIFVIIFSLNYAQLIPCFAGAKPQKIQVAILGIKFDDMTPELQKRVWERVLEAIESKPGLQILKPEDVGKLVATEKIAALQAKPDSSALRALAEQLQVNYIFLGRLANQSRDPERALLVGELNRFDRATNLLHRFEVLKYYDAFGVEIVKFKQEFVETINTGQKTGKLAAVWLVVGGLTIVGLAALALSSFRAGAEGEGRPIGDQP